MSNKNSALVRSNLGRNNALSALSTLSPNVINALSKLATKAIDRYVSSGARDVIPVNVEGPSRRPQRRRRGQGRNKASIPVGVGSNNPDVRRRVQVMVSLTSNSAGEIQWVGNLARGAVAAGGYGLLSDSALGNVANLFKMYTAFKVHTATVTFTSALPDSNSFSMAIGWTPSAPSTPTSYNLFPTYPSYVIGAKQAPIRLTGRPRNIHGGIVPVSWTATNDTAEMSAGSFVIYGTTNATTSTVGLALFDIEVTLIDI